MYHIRRADTFEERSLHQETPLGFEHAVVEAIMRTSVSQIDHEIVDGDGNVKHTVHAICCRNIDTTAGDIASPIDGMAKVAIQPWVIPPRLFMVTAVLAALFLCAWFTR